MSPRPYPVDWVDAFTTHAFGGNACAVVHGADDLSEATRTALVRETSLSECAYVVASDKADFGARYYLADKEILMAGHPTIATAISLLDRGLVPLQGGRAAFTLEVGAGVLSIEVSPSDSGPLVTMTQLQPQFGETLSRADIADIYGLEASDIIADPQIVSTGTPFCITLLRDHDALARASLQPGAWEAMNPPGTTRAGMIEPFLVTLQGASEAGDTFSRLLLPPPMPPEDPFTGSATGCMAAYLWHHGLIRTPSLTAQQGHWLNRPGQAQVQVLGPRDAPTGVKVGGQGRVLMRGHLTP